jgi:hypothetical protein
MKTRILIVAAAALGLLAACKGKGVSASADSAHSDYEMKKQLVKTADVNFKVKNVFKTGEAIAALTDQCKGMVMHHQMQSSVKCSENVHLTNDSVMLVSSYSTTADMTIRIPSEKLETFINQVSHMGVYVNSSKMDIEDKSLEYLSTKLKAENREELVDQQKTGKVVLKHPAETLGVKDDIVDKEINNLKTDEDVTYSTVMLSFYQTDTISKETVANDDPSAYNIPFFQRLTLAFANGWAIFVDVLIGLTNIWMFILAALAAWRGIVYYKKRVRLIDTPAK